MRRLPDIKIYLFYAKDKICLSLGPGLAAKAVSTLAVASLSAQNRAFCTRRLKNAKCSRGVHIGGYARVRRI